MFKVDSAAIHVPVSVSTHPYLDKNVGAIPVTCISIRIRKQHPEKIAQLIYRHHLARSGYKKIFTGRISPLLPKCFTSSFNF